MYSIIERVKLRHDIDGNVLMSSAFRRSDYINAVYHTNLHLLQEALISRLYLHKTVWRTRSSQGLKYKYSKS